MKASPVTPLISVPGINTAPTLIGAMSRCFSPAARLPVAGQQRQQQPPGVASSSIGESLCQAASVAPGYQPNHTQTIVSSVGSQDCGSESRLDCGPGADGRTGRREALASLAAAAGLTTLSLLGAPVASAAPSKPPSSSGSTPLEPLSAYLERLATAEEELEGVKRQLTEWASDSESSSDDDVELGDVDPAPTANTTASTAAVADDLGTSAAANDDDSSSDSSGEVGASAAGYAALQAALHAGELGRFWASARGADAYIVAGLPGERGALAREQADLFSLLPEAAGPLGRLLKPNWDDPDDRLCLIYSCVNDPNAPPSINALYALKLLHVGLGFGADGNEKVTPQGLLYNVDDALEKIADYRSLARRAGEAIPASKLSEDGALLGAAAPPASAERYGPSPLG
mmetsp:Transcript_5402/g.9711  ORF Transcript_5402/g.9711 Transcript_5402/m.9711 type:complete len:402 (-) Transcript_5402:160-1365(-)